MTGADRVLAGDPRAIARALSMVENGEPGAADLMAHLRARTGRALRVGLTGPPGAGKSTLADRLVAEYRRRGSRVAVLAVDPSSPFTGGAVLGDRIRMQAHAADAGVFIRSMATRGHLGGLARATADAADVLDAAGFELVCIETVGVGQAEVDVVGAADVVVVVVAPGGGDEIQALKAGVLEAGDLFVVNKADREDATRAAAVLEGMLSLQEPAPGAWRPLVLRTVATTGAGIAALVDAIEQFKTDAGSAVAGRRRARGAARVTAVDAREDVPPLLDHVGIAASDAPALATLLRHLFGLEADEPEVVGRYRVRFVGTGPTRLELVEALSSDDPVAKYVARRGTALHHVCFRVPDLERALERLKALGVTLLDEAPRPGAHGSRIAFLHPSSTGGILIELKEGSSRKPEAGSRESEGRSQP